MHEERRLLLPGNLRVHKGLANCTSDVKKIVKAKIHRGKMSEPKT
jgi:hypothetical protein